ncbi:hypothetical protein MGYG_01779 [Nannizzia gypsea CBS 118893]|uniref:Uncharacterized protein n=1 Tax=Arthroderma gypseum (strain ATCC MYA-4604 / CBS 118893) TaxID=535722 RepID=E5R3G4_ARTGP|nr:hypothetical protein MGYG_01779 [Nannizzia gypsea CBS 118893]EFQ98763.1 hypothetical protein MGYG_01779 [Nannizzia gypsea CBS 118893]
MTQKQSIAGKLSSGKNKRDTVTEVYDPRAIMLSAPLYIPPPAEAMVYSDRLFSGTIENGIQTKDGEFSLWKLRRLRYTGLSARPTLCLGHYAGELRRLE